MAPKAGPVVKEEWLKALDAYFEFVARPEREKRPTPWLAASLKSKLLLGSIRGKIADRLRITGKSRFVIYRKLRCFSD